MRSYTILAVAASVAAPALVSAVRIEQDSDALSTGKAFHPLISNAYQKWEANRGKRSDDESFELLAREIATQEPQTQHVTPGSKPETHYDPGDHAATAAGAHPHEQAAEQPSGHAGAHGHEGAKHGAAHLHSGEHGAAHPGSHLRAGQRVGKHAHRYGAHAGTQAHRYGKQVGKHAHRHGKSGKGMQGRRKGLHAQKGESAAQKGEHAAHHPGSHSSGHSAPAQGHPDAAEHPATHHTEASAGTGASAERPLETQAAASVKQHQRRGKFHKASKAFGLVGDAANAAGSVHDAWDSFKQHQRRGKMHKAGKAIGLVNDAANAASSIGSAWQSFHGREDSPYDFLYERDYELDELE